MPVILVIVLIAIVLAIIIVTIWRRSKTQDGVALINERAPESHIIALEVNADNGRGEKILSNPASNLDHTQEVTPQAEQPPPYYATVSTEQPRKSMELNRIKNEEPNFTELSFYDNRCSLIESDFHLPTDINLNSRPQLVTICEGHESMQERSQVQTVGLTCQTQRSAIIIEDDNYTLSSYCKHDFSSTPTSRDQLYPQLSPVSLGPELELSYVDPVDRITFDSKGGQYTNQDHHIYLKVPPAAVPKGEQVTVEIGVSLRCPILFPTGNRPISAMVSMCVVGNPYYQFLKPVEVRLSHCLDVATKEDVSKLEIEFLKSGHNLFYFHKAEGESTFEPGTYSGTLATKHFCCFCIAANESKADLSKIYYRLVKVVPRSTPSLHWKARYCITYFLKTCLQVSIIRNWLKLSVLCIG